MAPASSFPSIGHRREPRHQRRFRKRRIRHHPRVPAADNSSRTGPIDDTVDTSAAPDTILRRKHLKDHQKPCSPVDPPPPNPNQRQKRTFHSKDRNAGALSESGPQQPRFSQSRRYFLIQRTGHHPNRPTDQGSGPDFVSTAAVRVTSERFSRDRDLSRGLFSAAPLSRTSPVRRSRWSPCSGRFAFSEKWSARGAGESMELAPDPARTYSEFRPGHGE